MFYSDIPEMSEWVESQSMAARRAFSDYYLKLHNHAEIHPTYLGNEIISLLKVYDSYTGGAHGVNNYKLQTYTLSGKELKVKDLFDNWSGVKYALRLALLEQWTKRETEFGNEVYKSDREDLGMELVTVTDMGGELVSLLKDKLGEKGFIFTLYEGGVRFNLYFPRYSLGANPLGGSWISVPLEETPKIVRKELGSWLSKTKIEGNLPKGLEYFSQRTELKRLFPKPGKFNEEFVIGKIELEHKTGCLKELLDIIPKG